MLFRSVYLKKKKIQFKCSNVVFVIGGNISESKPLELDEIVGAKSSDDGCFYRGRIIEKTDDKNYGVLFIDFGFEACVNITDIVPLPIQLQQVKYYWQYYIFFKLIS